MVRMVYSYGDAMIIYHSSNEIYDSVLSCRGREPFVTSLRYIEGHVKPHYPVPAIPLAVAILPDLVQIAEVYWDDEYLFTQDTLPIQRAEFELVAEFEKD